MRPSAYTITRRVLPLGLLIAALGASAAAAAPPSSDEYLSDFPDAGGRKEAPGSGPKAEPGALPPAARRELGGSREDEVLGVLATADELGAPAAKGGRDRSAARSGATADPAVVGEDPSALAAATGSIDDPPVALLLVAVLATGGLLLLARRRAKRPER